MVVIQISRGIAPVISIVEAIQATHVNNCQYHVILCKPLVEAKNEAIEYALYQKDDMILIEDDILVPEVIWDLVLAQAWPENTVGYGHCRMRGGRDNVVRNEEGKFLATGNVFTVIAADILSRLTPPVFEAYTPHREGNDLRFSNRNARGCGSDNLFWYKLRHLPNPPTIIELGRVRHIRHPLNERQDNVHPCELREW